MINKIIYETFNNKLILKAVTGLLGNILVLLVGTYLGVGRFRNNSNFTYLTQGSLISI